jgi:hypothetical protein
MSVTFKSSSSKNGNENSTMPFYPTGDIKIEFVDIKNDLLDMVDKNIDNFCEVYMAFTGSLYSSELLFPVDFIMTDDASSRLFPTKNQYNINALDRKYTGRYMSIYFNEVFVGVLVCRFPSIKCDCCKNLNKMPVLQIKVFGRCIDKAKKLLCCTKLSPFDCGSVCQTLNNTPCSFFNKNIYSFLDSGSLKVNMNIIFDKNSFHMDQKKQSQDVCALDSFTYLQDMLLCDCPYYNNYDSQNGGAICPVIALDHCKVPRTIYLSMLYSHRRFCLDWCISLLWPSFKMQGIDINQMYKLVFTNNLTVKYKRWWNRIMNIIVFSIIGYITNAFEYSLDDFRYEDKNSGETRVVVMDRYNVLNILDEGNADCEDLALNASCIFNDICETFSDKTAVLAITRNAEVVSFVSAIQFMCSCYIPTSIVCKTSQFPIATTSFSNGMFYHVGCLLVPIKSFIASTYKSSDIYKFDKMQWEYNHNCPSWLSCLVMEGTSCIYADPSDKVVDQRVCKDLLSVNASHERSLCGLLECNVNADINNSGIYQQILSFNTDWFIRRKMFGSEYPCCFYIDYNGSSSISFDDLCDVIGKNDGGLKIFYKACINKEMEKDILSDIGIYYSKKCIDVKTPIKFEVPVDIYAYPFLLSYSEEPLYGKGNPVEALENICQWEYDSDAPNKKGKEEILFISPVGDRIEKEFYILSDIVVDNAYELLNFYKVP